MEFYSERCGIARFARLYRSYEYAARNKVITHQSKGSLVDDETILQLIERLSTEEQTLEESHRGEPLSKVQHDRLKSVEVQLDQAYDLLRQRRARRTAGQDPDEASVRPEGVVENYLQ
jgi:hypothetical protein